MSRAIFLQKIDILEWYDGWVAALLESETELFAGILVAFDPNRGERRYVLAGISHQNASDIRRLHGTEGMSTALNFAWSSALADSTDVVITAEEAIVGRTVHVQNAALSARQRLIQYQLPLVDVAVSNDAQLFWFAQPITPDSPP